MAEEVADLGSPLECEVAGGTRGVLGLLGVRGVRSVSSVSVRQPGRSVSDSKSEQGVRTSLSTVPDRVVSVVIDSKEPPDVDRSVETFRDEWFCGCIFMEALAMNSRRSKAS